MLANGLEQTLLKSNSSKAVLLREDASSKTAVSWFDHSDLNAYLLVVVGLATPDDEDMQLLYRGIQEKAQAQAAITLREIQQLWRKEELVTLPADTTLDKAIEVLGGGVHRILVTGQSSDVVGILSQLRLIEFFWHEGVNFPAIDRLYGGILRDLQIGSQQVIAIK
jgi:CBS-domain-containing membrane protein